jgi:hypothetical protein
MCSELRATDYTDLANLIFKTFASAAKFLTDVFGSATASDL